MRRLIDRVVALFRRDRIVSDIVLELRHHRDLLAERLPRVGLTRADAGLALGIAGAGAATRLLERLLFGVTPHDAATFAAVMVGVAAVAFSACAIPAVRAMRIDPIAALKDE